MLLLLTASVQRSGEESAAMASKCQVLAVNYDITRKLIMLSFRHFSSCIHHCITVLAVQAAAYLNLDPHAILSVCSFHEPLEDCSMRVMLSASHQVTEHLL